MIRSIRFVLTLWYVGILSVILLLFSWVLYSETASNLNREANELLVSQTDSISDSLFSFSQAEHEIKRTPFVAGKEKNTSDSPVPFEEDIKKGKFPSLILRWANKTNELEENTLRLMDPNGSTLAVSKNFKSLQLPSQPELWKQATAGQTLFSTWRQSKDHFRLVTRPVIEDHHVLYVVQMASPLDDMDQSLKQLRGWLTWLIPLTLMLASAVGWFLATKALGPVGHMVKKVQSIGVKDLHERLEVPDTHDELEQLAKTFNDLLLRLDRSFRRVRQFSAAAAHELRTPLSVMQGELEVTLRKARPAEEYQDILRLQLEVLGELSGIVDQLLALAHSEEGEESLEWKNIALGELVRQAVVTWKKIAESKHISMDFREMDTLHVRGEKRLLERLVSTFLDNAVKHTPSQGNILVEISRRDGNACLLVRDNGPGILPEELPKIFDKFFTVSAKRRQDNMGSGLGLGLCRWIAEVHQGRIEVSGKPGEGAEFRIFFPIAPAS